MFRYRLSLGPKNADVSSRVIEGMRLRKNAWLTSTDPIDFGSFSDLIESQEASSLEDFDALDNQQEVLQERAKVIKDNFIDSTSIRKALLDRGFTKNEIADRSIEALRALLNLDDSIVKKE